MPDRQIEGHGLNMEAVEGFVKDGVQLLITLDCGVVNHQEIARAKEAGLAVVVVDHHQVVDGLPPADAIINPHQEGDEYPFKHLCGAVLSFKLFQMLVSDGRMPDTWSVGQEKWLLDLVALATVADMMPMVGENRALVRYGLFVLAQTKRPGLRELCKVARIEPTFDSADLSTNLNEITIGFMLGPRINAASRMAHAGLAYDLLMAPDARSARAYALELEENNLRRKKEASFVERDVLSKLSGKDIPPFVVEGSPTWPVPLLGPVASKIEERYGSPVMLVDMSGDMAKASLRAPKGFDLVQALGSVSEQLIQFGGHPQAAGCTFEKNKFEQVKKELSEYAKERPTVERGGNKWEVELKLGEITLENAGLLEKLAPFGVGNPSPHFLVSGVELEEVLLMGKDNNHAKLILKSSDGTVCEAVFFFHNAQAEKLRVGELYTILGELSVNEWKGRKRQQLKIIEINHA